MHVASLLGKRNTKVKFGILLMVSIASSSSSCKPTDKITCYVTPVDTSQVTQPTYLGAPVNQDSLNFQIDCYEQATPLDSSGRK